MPRLRPRAVEPRGSLIEPTYKIDKSVRGEGNEPASPPQPPPDENKSEPSYLGKVIAYIPVESVALYQAAVNQLKPDDPLFSPAVWTILCATPLWQLWSTRNKGEPFALDQAIVSAPAFVFWLMGLQSPLVKAYFDSHAIPWNESYGTFFLIVGSLVLPVFGWFVLKMEKFGRMLIAGCRKWIAT